MNHIIRTGVSEINSFEQQVCHILQCIDARGEYAEQDVPKGAEAGYPYSNKYQNQQPK